MSPSKSKIDVAQQAEQELNSNKAKTGGGRGASNDDSGVDSSVENRFPGAEVKTGDDLVTNSGYNRKIPPEEGGSLDSKGRISKGSQFEGDGGPEDDAARRAQDNGGANDPDVDEKPIESRDQMDDNEIIAQGDDAVQANLAAPGIDRQQRRYPGDEYFKPESVPDSISAQGNIAPDSVIESSKDAEGY